MNYQGLAYITDITLFSYFINCKQKNRLFFFSSILNIISGLKFYENANKDHGMEKFFRKGFKIIIFCYSLKSFCLEVPNVLSIRLEAPST